MAAGGAYVSDAFGIHGNRGAIHLGTGFEGAEGTPEGTTPANLLKLAGDVVARNLVNLQAEDWASNVDELFVMLETPGTPVLHLRVFEGTVPNGVWKHGPGRPSYRRVWDVDEEESFGGGEGESESSEDTPPPTLVISIGPNPEFEGLPDWLEVPDRAHDVLAQVDTDTDDGPGEGQSFLDGDGEDGIPWLPRLFQWLWGGTPNVAKARVDVDTAVYDVPSPRPTSNAPALPATP